MCTVLLRLTPDGRWPVLLGAIRDEFADRPWDAPGAHWRGPWSALVGGRDRTAGGTWLAVDPSSDRPAVAALLNGVRRGRVYLTREPHGLTVDFEATAGTLGSKGAVGARTGVGGEMRLAAPGTLVFYVRVAFAPFATEASIPFAPRSASVSLVSDGRVVRTWSADQLTEVFEVECERDGYYRLEVRDKAGAMLAMTNPIYVKVGARR